MALIMYLTKAPKYDNTTAKEIMLIEDFLHWRHENKIKSRYSCESFEQWGGVPESELPDKYTIEYYRQFYTKKSMYVEGVGQVMCDSIFDQLARFVKANQIFNWFIKNVMDNNADQEYHEVTENQLKSLLDVCTEVRSGFTLVGVDSYYGEQYEVNVDVAEKLLPIMEERGHFFGVSNYGRIYIKQVIETIDAVIRILETTDFEKETVYFNAIW